MTGGLATEMSTTAPVVMLIVCSASNDTYIRTWHRLDEALYQNPTG